MPATTLIQNLYAQSPEEQDVAIAEALAKEDSIAHFCYDDTTTTVPKQFQT